MRFVCVHPRAICIFSTQKKKEEAERTAVLNCFFVSI